MFGFTPSVNDSYAKNNHDSIYWTIMIQFTKQSSRFLRSRLSGCHTWCRKLPQGTLALIFLQ